MSNNKSFFVPIIITINVIVYLMWTVFQTSFPPNFMMNNFTVSWNALLEGRYWTLLSSAFSHEMLFHIFINMFVLNSFGSLLERVLGSISFIRFYILASVLSSLSHSVVSAYLINDPSIAALGASGAVAGVILVFSLLFPREKILLFGIIPLPALFGALAFIALDLWGLVSQTKGGGLPIGHGAHLGGAFTGIVYYFLVLRPKFKKQK